MQRERLFLAMRALRPLAIMVSLAAAALGFELASAGCHSDATSPGAAGGSADAGSDVTSSTTSASSGSGGTDGGAGSGAEAGASPCPPFPHPSSIPPDWEDYTDWSCDCHFYIPGDNGAMPPPIEWEACPEPVPPQLGCRQMKIFWSNIATVHMAVRPLFWMDPQTTTSYLQFGRLRVADDHNTHQRLVAEVDGEVRVAITQLSPDNKCIIIGEGLNDGRYLFRVYDPKDEGALVGSLNEPHPTPVLKSPKNPQLLSAWAVSSDWIVRQNVQYTLTSWDLQTTVVPYDPAQDPDGMPAHRRHPHGTDLFFEVGVSGYRGVMSWNPVDGPRPVVRWYGDWTKGAGNFGTDQIDMVWEQCEGKAPSGGYDAYADCSVMTAPYTTDPIAAQANATRLRSDPGLFSVYPYVVGCGYAARSVHINHNDLLIVRLSDGVSWILYGANDPQLFSYMHPIGISCDEVFVTAQIKPEPVQILRIPLQSLGPGLPPD